MNAADYDAWYDTPRGRWVGDAECRMLLRAVEPRQGESLLDVGCGTGWFTRRMARLPGVQVTGLDINADWRRAVGEVVRVSRGRFAIGMLNRRSLLWREKGRNGGSGAYRGACWVTPEELRDSVAGLPVTDVRVSSAVFLPSGSLLARAVECLLPAHLAIGGLVVLSGRKR